MELLREGHLTSQISQALVLFFLGGALHKFSVTFVCLIDPSNLTDANPRSFRVTWGHDHLMRLFTVVTILN